MSFTTSSHHPSTPTTLTTTPQTTTTPIPSLQYEIDALQIQLTREKNMRKLERLKHSQTEQRLRRQIDFLVEESEHSKRLLEELRKNSDEDMEQINRSKQEILKQLRHAEKRIVSLEGSKMEREDGRGVVWKKKCELLEGKVNGLEEELEGLMGELERSRRGMKRELEQAPVDDDDDESVVDPNNTPQSKKHKSSSPFSSSSPVELSPAPPAIVSELNKTRVSLSNSQRKERIQARKVESLEQKLSSHAQLREQFQHLSDTFQLREQELKQLRNERERAKIVEEQWDQWRRSILEAMELEVQQTPEMTGMPPEVATVLRQFRKLQTLRQQAEQSQKNIRSELELNKQRLSTLETECQKLESKWNASQHEKRQMEDSLQVLKVEQQKLKAQLEIQKREAGSMRSLVQTFDETETTTLKEDKGGPVMKGLEVSLNSTKEEVKVLTEVNDTLNNELKKIREEMGTLNAEHERVLDKFGKLREALMKERSKAELAEHRACEAETLAGKGSYNTETTRVLHLQSNPFTESLIRKYETKLDELKQTIQNSTQSGDVAAVTKATTTASSLTAEKINQRLKEHFKEQIGLFREGVYLLTGYKIDMLVETDRPRFKVRSMYAENEDDHLMFIWPESIQQSQNVTSLDLLDSEFAHAICKTELFEYVTKFKSIPAFMGSLTLNLFERQTFVG